MSPLEIDSLHSLWCLVVFLRHDLLPCPPHLQVVDDIKSVKFSVARVNLLVLLLPHVLFESVTIFKDSLTIETYQPVGGGGEG